MSSSTHKGSEELARLREIARLGLAELESDKALDAFVERALKEFGLPIGLVSIVLDGAQHFIAQRGLGGWLQASAGTPREWAFCNYAVQDKARFVVEDATRHDLVSDNPLVLNDGVRSYAGAPLITRTGQAVGTLCVIGDQPRVFSAEELARLEVLAAEVIAYLESKVEAG